MCQSENVGVAQGKKSQSTLATFQKGQISAKFSGRGPPLMELGLRRVPYLGNSNFAVDVSY